MSKQYTIKAAGDGVKGYVGIANGTVCILTNPDQSSRFACPVSANNTARELRRLYPSITFSVFKL